MENKRKVVVIPARLEPKLKLKRVGVYCRVSTRDRQQLNSIANQAAGLVQRYSMYPNWKVVDIFIDVASAKVGSYRPEFTRMIECCKAGKLDVVVAKSVDRFGRDAVEVLKTVRELVANDVRVIIGQYDSDEDSGEVELTLISGFIQAENESRSENIKDGIKKLAALGTSKLYWRKCYGYETSQLGALVIDEETAKNVRIVYELYLGGMSLVSIVNELEKRKIQSPTGKRRWSKRSVDLMLNNEKYTGNVRLLKNTGRESYLKRNTHPAIIPEEVFNAVQEEKIRRTNIVHSDAGIVRKSTRFVGVKEVDGNKKGNGK